jgi:dihydrofolate reductase
MIQFVSFIATSLDGYIARPENHLHPIDWLDQANTSVPEGEDCGFSQFIQTIDALVMGRKTFELLLTFDLSENWPYGNIPIYVLSSSLEFKIPEHIPKSVHRFILKPSQSIQTLVDFLDSYDYKRVYVDGGHCIQSFIRAHKLHEMTITQVPVLIGQGRSLFSSIENDIQLKHIYSKAYDFGYVQNTYLFQYSLPSQ